MAFTHPFGQEGSQKDIGVTKSELEEWKIKLVRATDHELKRLSLQNARHIFQAGEDMDAYKTSNDERVQALTEDVAWERSCRKGDWGTTKESIEELQRRVVAMAPVVDVIAADTIKGLREELRRAKEELWEDLRRTNEEHQRWLSLYEAELLRMRQERDDDRRAISKVVERLEAQLNATNNNFAASQRS